MSHDDRIRQLTDLFIEDLRGPIETSLHQLLAQMMGIAAQEQVAAVDRSLAGAAAENQAALEAAREFERQQRDLAVEALEADLAARHAAALEEARAFDAQQRDLALEALEAELAQRHGTALDAALEFASQQRDQALESLEADLTTQHAAAHEALRAQLAAEQEQALNALRAELTEHHARELDALRGDLAAEHEKALDAVRLEMGERHEETLASVTVEAQAEHDGRLQALHEDLTREHEAALGALRDQLEREHEAKHGDTVAAAEALLAAAHHERDAARASVAELTDQLAAARAQHEQLVALAHAESAAAEQLSVAAHPDARAEEREFELACSERLLVAIRQLDEARTLSDVLSVTIEHVTAGSLRGAVLLLQAGRLRGWRSTGLGDAPAGSIEVPLERPSFVADAIERGVPISTRDAAELAEVFPSLPQPPPNRVGLALPILVGGRAVALLYVDDGNSETPVVPSNWPEQAEILTRHAGRCLEALTLARANGLPQRASQEMRPAPAAAVPRPVVAAAPVSVREADEAQEEESARRHARLLISEIKLYNETQVEQGRREGNLLALLGSEIERARRLYEEKIPAAVRERVNCFDDEIVRTLAGGDRALLGQVRDGQTT